MEKDKAKTINEEPEETKREINNLKINRFIDGDGIVIIKKGRKNTSSENKPSKKGKE